MPRPTPQPCRTAHTHAFDAAETTPYLSVTSSEKKSGKSRLLETLSLLVARPWLTSRVTAAVLVRKTAKQRPTLLLDESDAAFKGEREYAEALRAVLNAGYRQGGVVSLCLNKGDDFADFPVFGPKAIAGIGKLPDTVQDRSVPIALKRRAPGERVAGFRWRQAKGQADPLREKVEAGLCVRRCCGPLGPLRPTNWTIGPLRAGNLYWR